MTRAIQTRNTHAAARFSRRMRDAGVIAPALGGKARPFLPVGAKPLRHQLQPGGCPPSAYRAPFISVVASPLGNVERPSRSLPSQPAGATL